MSKNRLSRRGFLTSASAATVAAAGAASATGGVGAAEAKKLAALGGTAVRKRPFPAWPPVSPEIEQSLVSAFRARRWGRTLQGPMQGAGLTVEFEKQFAKLLGAKYCLATGSCTQALHTALHSVGVGAGDEVLVSPCTYIASIQAILMCDALPVFVDVDLDTFEMDASKMSSLIGANTRAVETVHIAGLPCDMDKIVAVASGRGLTIVEDAAQAVLAEYRGKRCGTIGALGCISFQTSKQLACGEGGAILGNDRELIEKCYTFHNLGFSTGGGVPGTGIGTKYRMNEFEAALLIPQLATVSAQTQTRNDNARYLARKLAEIPGIAPQKLHEGVTQGAYYLYGFRYLKQHFNEAPRAAFLKALRAEGIPFTTMYFDRLNTQPFVDSVLGSPTFQKIYSPERLRRYREQNHCPVNDRLAEEAVWLPQTVFLGTHQDMDDIAEAMAKIHEAKGQLAKL